MTSQTPTDQVAVDPSDKYLRAWAGLQRLVREGQTFSGYERTCVYYNMGAQKASASAKGGPDVEFANISTVSGMDAADDSRSICLTDWDGDGRLDLWMANRTAPRVRFYRNVHPSPGAWLQVQLQGVTANRDAIGARVEVHAGGRIFIESLRAGEGFLAQSSKTLHFGLGAVEKLDRLRIRWPGGDWEEITGAATGGRFRIIQGSGQATPVKTVRELKLAAAPYTVPPLTEQARILAVDRPVMPRLPVQTWDEAARALDLHAKAKPLLILLWASWCAPCATELAELQAAREKMPGLELAAICLDTAAVSPHASVDKARALLKATGFTAPVYGATADLLTRLDLVQQSILNRWIALPLPCSFLLTKDHTLAAIYKGPVTPEILRADLDLLPAAPEAIRTAAVPFPGRWLSPVIKPDPVRMASRFIEAGADDTAIEYLTDVLGSPQELEPDTRRSAFVKLGSAYFRKNARGPALSAFQEALALNSKDHQTLNSVGVILMEAGRLPEAISYYQKALAIDKFNTLARANLAISLHSLGRIAEAVPHYRENLRLRKEWPVGANNLAWILATSPDDTLRNGPEALALAQKACAATTRKNPLYLATLAAALAETGNFPAAAATATEALQIIPKSDATTRAQITASLASFHAKKPWRDIPKK